jgi:hypothetical protein
MLPSCLSPLVWVAIYASVNAAWKDLFETAQVQAASTRQVSGEHECLTQAKIAFWACSQISALIVPPWLASWSKAHHFGSIATCCT